MLDYIKIELTEAIGYSYVVKQINVIVNDVEDSENWYNGSHLISCILSIFNCKKTLHYYIPTIFSGTLFNRLLIS